MARDVVVVGAGIAGLALAWELATRPGALPDGADVHVLDAAPRAGGNIRSERRDGYLCEWGPTGFLDDARETVDACARLGLDLRVTAASVEGERRFVARGGKLRELPRGPASFLVSDILTWRGRLRVLVEAVVPRRRDATDESVFDFARRRVGPEAERVLVDALVTGIWAGTTESLSLRSAFPRLARLERDHGGLLRGVVATRDRRGRLTSFPEGLAELPDALASSLGTRVRLNSRVTSVAPADRGGFRVDVHGESPMHAAAVVLACPSWEAARLVAGLDGELSAQLASIPTVGVAVLHLGFKREDAGALAGFGFLVPRGEDASVLGVLLPSNIFPQRAPEGHLLATVMMGGARDPSAVDASDDAVVATAAAALARLAGVRKAPRFAFAVRHARAIPQYVVGHEDRLAAIDDRLRRHPGLFLSGNSYRGIAINACVTDARKVAGRVAALFA